MIRFVLLTLCTVSAGVSLADSSVTVPWQEFSALYSAQLEEGFKDRQGTQAPEPIFTIEEASYRLTLDGAEVTGRIEVTGKVIRGKPEPIALFGRDLAVMGVELLEGGTLISDDTGYRFFTEGEVPFRLTVAVSMPVRIERGVRYIAFEVPNAINNNMEIDLPDGIELASAPGPRHADGRYYFSPRDELRLRIRDQAEALAEKRVNIDVFTVIALDGDRYILSAYFAPAHPINSPLIVTLNPDVRFRSTSLEPYRVTEEQHGALTVVLPAGWDQLFSIEYEIDATSDTAAVPLPRIADNRGREGEFQLLQPAYARLTIASAAVRDAIPVTRLPSVIQRFAGVEGRYLSAQTEEAIRIEIERFDAVGAAEIVLDAVRVSTSFTENGRALTVIGFTLPVEAGHSFELEAIPSVKIWSVTVNGKAVDLYTRRKDRWTIPLATGGPSKVELAYLAKVEKLGLQGRLSLTIPHTGLTAQRVNLTVALPARVELIALESDLRPANGDAWPRPPGIEGTPHYFSQLYYRGDALEAAIYYKEPIITAQGESS